MTGLNAHAIQPLLWQGVEPEHADIPFDLLVVCYMQRAPYWDKFRGQPYSFLEAPMDDDQRTMREEDGPRAQAAADVVAHAIRGGRCCFVTCGQGMNRSGMVSALTLMRLHSCTGAEAVKIVKERRPGALYNPSFVAYLERLA